MNDVQEIIQQVNDSNNIVIAVLTTLGSGIVSLLIYIWKQNTKASDLKHEEYKGIHKELTDNVNILTTIAEKHDTKIEFHKETLDRHETELKDLRA